MIKHIFLFLLFISLLNATEKITIGAIESVTIMDTNITQKARIDTGATITSLHAKDIEIVEMEKRKYVKFRYFDHNITTPFIREVEIKRHDTSPSIRPVVMMNLRLGNITRKIEVSLTDRSKFDYPILIGRNFLSGDFVVDVSQ